MEYAVIRQSAHLPGRPTSCHEKSAVPHCAVGNRRGNQHDQHELPERATNELAGKRNCNHRACGHNELWLTPNHQSRRSTAPINRARLLILPKRTCTAGEVLVQKEIEQVIHACQNYGKAVTHNNTVQHNARLLPPPPSPVGRIGRMSAGIVSCGNSL